MGGEADTQFLDALYRGVIDSQELKRALALVQQMFSCRGSALVSLDAQAPVLGITMTGGIFEEHGRLYIEQFAKIDPAPAIFASLPGGTASTTDRIMSAKQLKTDPFANEFFRPLGLVETLGGTLFSDRARFSLIGLQRGQDRPAFDDDEIGRLERLMPHIARVLQLRRAFFRIQSENLALQLALDSLSLGVALLDMQGAGVFVNAALRTIAQRADGLALDRTGRPLPVNLNARRRLDGLLNDVANGGAGGLLTLPRARGAVDYVLLVAPVPAPISELDWERNAHSGAIMLVHDPASRPLHTNEILERGLHLTPGAARVVAALAADDDLKSFAEREGVTIHTARFHLRTAMARTGARSQAEVVRIAVRMLRDVALGGRQL
jgi:DNA-binding CsgD family transcriptional regulator